MAEWEYEERNQLWELLSQGLDLCIRARKIDEAYLEHQMKKIGWTGGRSMTPHVWVQQQYDDDLADWEARVRKHLTQNPFIPKPKDI